MATDDVNRVFVTAEHDGAWDIQPTRDANRLYWTFVNDYEIHEVHIAKLLAAPSIVGAARTLYMMTTQGGSVSRSTRDGGPNPDGSPSWQTGGAVVPDTDLRDLK